MKLVTLIGVRSLIYLGLSPVDSLNSDIFQYRTTNRLALRLFLSLCSILNTVLVILRISVTSWLSERFQTTVAYLILIESKVGKCIEYGGSPIKLIKVAMCRFYNIKNRWALRLKCIGGLPWPLPIQHPPAMDVSHLIWWW